MVRWLFITLAALYLVLFGLVMAGTIPPPRDGVFSHSPWFLGVAAVFFLFLAVCDWIVRLKANVISEERAAEMHAQRVAEISGWLRERVTAEEATRRATQGAGELTETIAREFEEWVRSNSSPGDELWYYDTGEDTWENLCGESGFALVREGRVIEFWMDTIN